jgi:hypothetical protein
VSETEALFGILRQSSDADCAAAIESAVANAPDHELCRVNALAFATENKLDEERAIAAFLHATRLGLFELSWNVLCPDCGVVLEAGATLKTVNHDEYSCTLCAAAYKPTLDEMVEVTFTVSPRVRRIAGRDPETLPEVGYYRQIFWSSGMDVPDDLAALSVTPINCLVGWATSNRASEFAAPVFTIDRNGWSWIAQIDSNVTRSIRTRFSVHTGGDRRSTPRKNTNNLDVATKRTPSRIRCSGR